MASSVPFVAAAFVLLIGAAAPPGTSGPPRLTTTLPRHAVAHRGELLEFQVTATFPRVGPIDLVLLDPPLGCIFTPERRSSASAPTNVAAGSVRWEVPEAAGGTRRLTFRATDRAHGAPPLVAAVEVRVDGASLNAPILFGDVTGDGRIDAIAGATSADVLIGSTIRADVGAIYVWNGTTTPSGTPDAMLLDAGANVGDGLGSASGQGIQLADVTGDGVLDVVAGASSADFPPGSGANVGAIQVWAGGPGLAGTPAPTATLRVSGAVAQDQLGLADGQGIQLADVTGDKVRDVIACARMADVAGVADVGAIQVWAGGAALAGTPAPLATLTVPGATAGDQLGSAKRPWHDSLGQGVSLADVTGDGILDLAALSVVADVAGVVDAGAIQVWAGGATLSGSIAPLATLTIPGAITSDNLGLLLGNGVQFGDVTGDTVADVVAGSLLADVPGAVDGGAIYVWRGGVTLVGTPAPRATLIAPGAQGFEFLGLGAGQGVQLAEVTGDGILDVVAGDPLSSIGGVYQAGAIFVWRGGLTLSGAAPVFATLTAPNATVRACLSDSKFTSGQLIVFGDVTGDGQLDLVAGAPDADVGAQDAGAIYVWKGGAAIAGSPAPLATLANSSAVPGDALGVVSFSDRGLHLLDVTADGQLDVVAGQYRATIGGVGFCGAIRVWSGGASLIGTPAPLATLSVPGAAANDYLCYGTGQALHFADVTGDGAVDVIAGGFYANVAGVVDAGAVYVWKCGAGLAGSVAPVASLHRATPVTADQLGDARSQGLQIADVTGDAILDVIVAARHANPGGISDAGAIEVWAGGATLSGSPAPTATLAPAGAKANDQLGEAGGQAVHFADVTGDGILDVIGGASFADGAKADVGFLYLWSGGATLLGAPAPTSTLGVPGAKLNDRLGS